MATLRLLLVTLLCVQYVRALCLMSGTIECGTNGRRTNICFICDGDNDCGDYSDEETALCRAWRNDRCSRGYVRCRRQGVSTCVPISRYCEGEEPPCEGDLDMRLCELLKNDKLRPLEAVQLPSDERVVRATCPESEMIECGKNGRCTSIRYICDGDNDCRDFSDEERGLCTAWRNDQCQRGSVRCRRHGVSTCVPISRYCERKDPPCEGDLDMRLCEMLKNNKLQPLESVQLPNDEHVEEKTGLEIVEEYGEEFLEIVNGTLKHPKCPALYTSLNGHCISIFFLAKVNWGEARAFCKTIGGDILTLDHGVERFYHLVRHLLEHEVTDDFWVGGALKNETEGWTWVNGHKMELGTPYWALRHGIECANGTREVEGGCSKTYQAPEQNPVGHCAALNYENYFYISDEKCLEEKGVLCALAKNDEGQ